MIAVKRHNIHESVFNNLRCVRGVVATRFGHPCKFFVWSFFSNRFVFASEVILQCRSINLNMATGLPSNIELKCKVCFLTLRIPRTLPCQHTFCEDCLKTHIECEFYHDSKRTSFNCPTCKLATSPTNKDSPHTDWAMEFPFDTYVQSMLNLHEELLEKTGYCDICKQNGEFFLAEIWCKQCEEKYCSSCQRIHFNMKACKSHTAIPVIEPEDINLHAEEQLCVPHRDYHYPVLLFCLDHKEICCAFCLIDQHRSCKDVRKITDMAEECVSKRYEKGIMSKLTSIQDRMKEYASEIEAAIELDKRPESFQKNVDAFFDRTVSRLEKLKTNVLKNTERRFIQQQTHLSRNNKFVKGHMEKIEACLKMLEAPDADTPENDSRQQQLLTEITSNYERLAFHVDSAKELTTNTEANDTLSQLTHTMQVLTDYQESTDEPMKTNKSSDILEKVDDILDEFESQICPE